MLNLIGECHSLSYDALTAHVAMVFTRYMLIALTGRRNEDIRTIGEIFFFLSDEFADITFARSIQLLLKAVFESIYRNFTFTEEHMDSFITDFVLGLPEYMCNALAKVA